MMRQLKHGSEIDRKVKHTFLCNQALPTRRQSDHYDTYSRILCLNTDAVSPLGRRKEATIRHPPHLSLER